MTLWQACRRWLMGPALVVGLAACGTVPRPAATDDDALARQAATDTVASGYTNIADKYIDSLSVADIALDGLKGLSAIDSAVTITRRGDSVTLSANNQEAWRLTAPPDGDAVGWARLTVDAYAAARGVSPAIAQAPIEDVYEAVFDGALSELDVFSHYSSADKARRNRARRNGYGGVGIRVGTTRGVARVTTINDNTPAAKAGIRRGDLIVKIDGQSTENVKLPILIDMLRGAAGTRVTLTLQRPGQKQPYEVRLARTLIVPRTVIAQERDGILTLKITGFNQNTAHSLGEQIKAARAKLGDALEGVVLDLRGNPGGLLNQAIRIADLFLERGNIVDTQGRHPASYQHYEAGGTDYAGGLPLILLLDGRSASSSEVLAAALQDQKRAVVIGTTSFGKGTVQTVIRLPNDGEMTLTWSRLVTPSGYALHGLGVHPSICTSGRAETDEARLLQSDATADIKAEAAFAQWRKVAIGDLDKRENLRQSCPAESRDDDLEAHLARRLILDDRLYGHIIDTTTTPDGLPTGQSARRPGS